MEDSVSDPPIKGKGKQRADEAMSSDDLDSPAKRRLFKRVNLKGFKAIKGVSKPFKSARERKKISLPMQSTLPTPPATPSGPPTTSTKPTEARPMTPGPSTTSPEGTSTQISGAGPSRHGLSLSPGSWSRSRPRLPPISVHETAAARFHEYVVVGDSPPSPPRRKFPRSLKASPNNKPWHNYALKLQEKHGESSSDTASLRSVKSFTEFDLFCLWFCCFDPTLTD
ncbi:hypothetical protein HYDPIDRAFT_107221, partial [Hydnomerulius pinastri MD-312]